ncbi:MAG: PleD family two-component system response regulator [Planctomycetota bacterium]
MRVLLADPHAVARNQLTELLQDRGHEVLLVEEADDCLESLQGMRPDLLLLESQLPANGSAQVLTQLRSDRSSLTFPVILVSDDISLFDPRAYPNLVGWIRKPFRLSDLLVLMDYAKTQWPSHKKKTVVPQRQL